jgi:hypothetical protein
MGAVVAEVYARTFPNTVIALLILHGVPPNYDEENWFPNPDASGFDLAVQPQGVTPELLRQASVYNPENINSEGLQWNSLSDYIPIAGSPSLQGPTCGTPLLTVVGHDTLVYANQIKQVSLRTTNRLSLKKIIDGRSWA